MHRAFIVCADGRISSAAHVFGVTTLVSSSPVPVMSSVSSGGADAGSYDDAIRPADSVIRRLRINVALAAYPGSIAEVASLQ